MRRGGGRGPAAGGSLEAVRLVLPRTAGRERETPLLGEREREMVARGMTGLTAGMRQMSVGAPTPRLPQATRTMAPRLVAARRQGASAVRSDLLGSKTSIASVASLASGSAGGARTRAVGSCCRPARTTTTSKYKLKTRKASAKRFKVTGNGKVMRRKQGKQHLNTKKNAKRKRFLSQPAVVEKADVKKNIKGSMPNHKIR